MDELIKMISDKLGVTPDKATMAVELVANHLKAKAPALSGQIDSLLAGDVSGAAGALGGLLGGNK